MDTQAWVGVRPSDAALRANNPIRRIVENIKKPDLPDKPLIPLSLGDPTVFSNFRCPDLLVRTVEAHLKSHKHNGYIHSAGTVEARKAVAARESVPGAPALTADDVVIASGCSGALELCISVLLNPGDNLLIPRPAFPLYQTLCEAKGISVKSYGLLPERGWEADLEELEAAIDSSTRALLVNNPSNPCGSVYSRPHLEAILRIAEKHRLPVIADEIYANLIFKGNTFHPMAGIVADLRNGVSALGADAPPLRSCSVPILSCGGIAKEFLVPGWRVGWVTLHDPAGVAGDIRRGLFALSQLILGANSLVVSALPSILAPTPGSPEAAELADFHAATVAQLEENALFSADRLGAIPGLDVVRPQGAMYVMFRVRLGAEAAADGANGGAYFDPATCGFSDDLTFAQQLLTEENVFVLPGTCFSMPGYARVVFCAPRAKLGEAYDRMAAFCGRRVTLPHGTDGKESGEDGAARGGDWSGAGLPSPGPSARPSGLPGRYGSPLGPEGLPKGLAVPPTTLRKPAGAGEGGGYGGYGGDDGLADGSGAAAARAILGAGAAGDVEQLVGEATKEQ